MASCVYYLLLALMRFIAVVTGRKGAAQSEKTMAGFIGVLLAGLSLVFAFIVFVSISSGSAAAYGTIPMITIATYTFTKITMAIIKAVRHRAYPSPLIKALHAIRYAEVAVSLLTMQRSMLVSFGQAGNGGAHILNICTGTGVCLFMLMLGVATIINSRKEI